jgi:hypothetical protein
VHGTAAAAIRTGLFAQHFGHHIAGRRALGEHLPVPPVRDNVFIVTKTN